MLYTDDDERNATATVVSSNRDHRPTAVLRPVRQVTIAGTPAAATVTAQPTYAQQPGYMMPPGWGQQGWGQQGWGQQGWGQQGWGPGFNPAFGGGFHGGGFRGGNPWNTPWAGPGAYGGGNAVWGAAWPSGPSIGQSLAGSLGTLIEIGTGIAAAFQSLPDAPDTTSETFALPDVVDYQTRLAEHAKGDERLRTIGTAGGKLVDVLVKMFAPTPNPSMFALAAPRMG